MKTTNRVVRNLKCCGMALAISGLALLPVAALAQKGDGAAKLIQLKPIATVTDAEAVKPGDMVVMSCPKCKDTWVTVVEQPTKTGAKAESKTLLRHACPGCENKIVSEGHGKAKIDKIVHVCKNCGSEDAYCCVLKKGEIPTKGMEKDKK